MGTMTVWWNLLLLTFHEVLGRGPKKSLIFPGKKNHSKLFFQKLEIRGVSLSWSYWFSIQK
jgi:hypothetical protein